VCWGYRFYLVLCICVLKILVLPLSMFLCVEDIGFTSFYVKEVILISWTHKYTERGKTDILNTQIHRKNRFYFFLCICVLRISVYLFLCICVFRISVLPLSMYLCVEDISFISFYDLCVEDIGFTSFYDFIYIERGKTDILNIQIHGKM
jgi:hypothetical protein